MTYSDSNPAQRLLLLKYDYNSTDDGLTYQQDDQLSLQYVLGDVTTTSKLKGMAVEDNCQNTQYNRLIAHRNIVDISNDDPMMVNLIDYGQDQQLENSNAQQDDDSHMNSTTYPPNVDYDQQQPFVENYNNFKKTVNENSVQTNHFPIKEEIEPADEKMVCNLEGN